MSYTHFGQSCQRCKKSYAPLRIEKNISGLHCIGINLAKRRKNAYAHVQHSIYKRSYDLYLQIPIGNLPACCFRNRILKSTQVEHIDNWSVYVIEHSFLSSEQFSSQFAPNCNISTYSFRRNYSFLKEENVEIII